MILSRHWLQRYLDALPDDRDVVRGLEQLGIEVADIGHYGENFNTIELVEVLTRTDHPDSDHLHLITVRRGDGSSLQIVTGASNGFPGEHVWYAPPGTTLPDGRTLEAKELRGILSPGMLLSAEELGYQALGGDLWVWEGTAPLGTRFVDVIGGVDTVYELELTPNLAQYLQSVRRIAAELGAIWDQPIQYRPRVFAYQQDPLALVADVDRCPVYGLVEFSIKRHQVSPLWMQALLRAVGQRIIHPAVDVTNFVMWDLGLPLHAFDATVVDGEIIVRRSQEGEHLALLDGTSIDLQPDDLVISDKTRALALAGIMGGDASAIQPHTDRLLLECAHFSAPGIFRSYKAHNLFTDAAQHFGKGTDPASVLEAPAMVIDILQEAGILETLGFSTMVGELPVRRQIAVDPERIQAILGVDIAPETISMALERFGYQYHGDEVMVPSYRHDVESIYDLAEDVGRFIGIDNIPNRLPVFPTRLAERDEWVTLDESLRDVIAAAGYHEVMTRTFTHPELDRAVSIHPQSEMVAIANPLRDDESVLRRHLLASLLGVVKYNRARHDGPIRFFEVGTVFHKIGQRVVERQELAVVLGLDPIPRYPIDTDPSIYDLTGLSDILCERLGWSLTRRADDTLPSFLHPGRSQWLFNGEEKVGYVGELLPSFATEYQVRRLGVLVVNLDGLTRRPAGSPRRPSRFPEVQRDLSLIVPEGITYEHIVKAIQGLQLPFLQELSVVNRFEGDFGVSLTTRLCFQAEDHTLQDSDVEESVSRILAELESLGVGIRQ